MRDIRAIAGDNEAGVTHAPGFGKALADHVVHGSSELTDLEGWRIDRFEGAYSCDEDVAAALAAQLAEATGAN